MAVMVTLSYPDMSSAAYDEVISSLDLDANPPAGAILHVAGTTGDATTVCEIWQTEQTFRAYYDYRLQPAFRSHGLNLLPKIEVEQLHNVFAVDMGAVERLGAVSLPGHLAGSAL